MKIYVMRHCERNMKDCSFESPLIYEGQINAKNKYNELHQKNINVIYSSPFLRTIQTGDFYSKMKELSINIDYSIAEYVSRKDKMNMNSIFDYKIPKKWEENFKLNTDNMIKRDYNPNESLKDAILRVYTFILNLKNKYKDSNDNILIITHMSIVNIILGLQKNFKFINDIDSFVENYYPMGLITELK